LGAVGGGGAVQADERCVTDGLGDVVVYFSHVVGGLKKFRRTESRKSDFRSGSQRTRRADREGTEAGKRAMVDRRLRFLMTDATGGGAEERQRRRGWRKAIFFGTGLQEGQD
jgi:hypothetical protein